MVTTTDKRGSDAATQLREQSNQEVMQVTEDIIRYLQEYARQKPEVVACWCLGIGFFLGWKLKPW